MRVCVIGLGAMGVAATRVLAERGHRVIGIDRHGVANDLGSSAHGHRIFRLAHDRPEYVRLARRALLHWRELERRDGAALLRATGLLEVGGPHDEIVAALRAEHATVVELDGAEAPDLFPGLTPRLGQPARWQPAAGVLAARDCLLVQADLAARAGAEIATGEDVVAIEAADDRAVVRTRLRRLEVDVVVVATGPWLNQLLRPLGLEQPIESAMSQTSVFRGTGWDARPCLIEWDRDGDRGGVRPAGGGQRLQGRAAADDELDPRRRGAPARPHRGADAGPPRRRPLRRARPAAGAHRALPTTTTPDGHFLLDRRGATVVAGALLRARLHVLARAGRGDRRPGRGRAIAGVVPDRPTRTLDSARNLLKTADTRSGVARQGDEAPGAGADVEGRADSCPPPRTPTEIGSSASCASTIEVPFQRLVVVLGCVLGTLAAPAGALAAEDLVVLDGDPAPLLQGTLTYAKVYINSTVRLTNNTVLNVDSLYIGPRAQLQSCWVPDPVNPLEAGDPAGCTNGRSLTIRSRGAVQITPPISLQGGTGAARAGGALFITGTAITLGGAVNTAGVGGCPLRQRHPRDRRPAAPAVGRGAGRDREPQRRARRQRRAPTSTCGPTTAARPCPARAPRAGSVGVASTAGNISVRSGVLADGGAAGARRLPAVQPAGVTLRGGDVRVGNVQTSGGSTQDQVGGNAGPIRIGARGRATIGALAANGGTAATGRAGQAAVHRGARGAQGASSARRRPAVPAAPLGGGNGSTIRIRGAAIVASASRRAAATAPRRREPGRRPRRQDRDHRQRPRPRSGPLGDGRQRRRLRPGGRGGAVVVAGTRVQIGGGVGSAAATATAARQARAARSHSTPPSDRCACSAGSTPPARRPPTTSRRRPARITADRQGPAARHGPGQRRGCQRRRRRFRRRQRRAARAAARLPAGFAAPAATAPRPAQPAAGARSSTSAAAAVSCCRASRWPAATATTRAAGGAGGVAVPLGRQPARVRRRRRHRRRRDQRPGRQDRRHDTEGRRAR